MNRTAVVLALLTLIGCTTPLSEASSTGSPTAGLGQVANVENLRIKPVRVIEDSRCPINAVCVWAGRLVVRTEIDSGAGAETADLVLGTPFDFGGVTVTLVEAQPSKLAGAPIKPSGYHFTFAVSRDR